MPKPRTLYDKIWDDHVIDTAGDASLIYHRPPPCP